MDSEVRPSNEHAHGHWRFDHLGLVVKRLGKGRERMGAMLPIRQWTHPIEDVVNGVRLQFGRDESGMVYELLEPLGEDSPVYVALQTGKGILNHVAYAVGDLAAGGAHLVAAGAFCVSEAKPAIAYGGRSIQFFVTPLRFVVELIEAAGHEHEFSFVASV